MGCEASTTGIQEPISAQKLNYQENQIAKAPAQFSSQQKPNNQDKDCQSSPVQIQPTKRMTQISIKDLSQIVTKSCIKCNFLSNENLQICFKGICSLFLSTSNAQQVVDIFLKLIQKFVAGVIQVTFWEKLAVRLNRINFNAHFDNLNSLIVLGTVLENKDDFIQANIFDRERNQRILKAFRYKACERDINAFAFVYLYLELGCRAAQKDGKPLEKIVQQLKEQISYFGTVYPPAPPLPESQDLHVHPTWQESKQNYTMPQIKIENLTIEDKKKQILLLIDEQIKQAERNMKAFKQLITQPCQTYGFGMKMGIKVKDLKDSKNVDRVIEKLFKKQLKQIRKKKNLKSKILDEYYNEESLLYEKVLEEIYTNKSKVVFTISDMLRAKCLFDDVKKINKCATEIKKGIKDNGHQLIQIDNRFRGKTNTQDLVFKIKIGGTITQLQLANKFNYVQNQFSHKIYEIDRSTYFETINFLRKYNGAFSKNYATKINDMTQYNCANLNYSQQMKTYGNSLKGDIQLYSDLNLQWPSFRSNLPIEIREAITSTSQLFGKISEKDEQNIQKLKKTNYSTLIPLQSDTHYLINAKFSFQMKKYQDAISYLEKIENPEYATSSPGLQPNKMLGESYYALRKYSEALQYLGQSKNILIDKFGKDNITVAEVYNKMAAISNDLGRYPVALNFYRQSLQIYKNLGSSDQQRAVALNGMGLVYEKKFMFKEALQCYNQCIEIDKKNGKQMSQGYAATLHNIGIINLQLKKYDEALSCFRKCLQIDQKLSGKGSQDTAQTIKLMGQVCVGKGQYDQAMKYFEEALQIINKLEGPNSANTANTYNFIANLFKQQFQYQQAISYYEKSLQVKEITHGKDSFPLVSTYNDLALLYQHIRKIDQAKKLYEKCIQITQKEHGRFSLQICPMLNNLAGLVKLNPDEIQTSLDLYNECLQIQRQLIGRDSIEAAKTLRNIGIFYLDLKYKSYATAHLEQAFLIFDQKLGNSDPETVETAKLYKKAQQ